ncbi:MAG: molybdenum cofactor guanylyltransferase [Tumebacillaceae bacterium]
MRGILLCGGQSRRMGQKKQWLPFGGRPLLLHTLETMYAVCTDVVVVANEEDDIERLHHLGVTTVRDLFVGQGPLAGLHAGLQGMAPDEVACLLGCDLPLMRADVLRDLLQEIKQHPRAQAVVPQDGTHLYPVCALYHGQVRDVAASCLENGQNAMRHFLARLEVRYESVERWQHFAQSPFLNMNTPQDYELACTLWKEGFGRDE